MEFHKNLTHFRNNLFFKLFMEIDVCIPIYESWPITWTIKRRMTSTLHWHRAHTLCECCVHRTWCTTTTTRMPRKGAVTYVIHIMYITTAIATMWSCDTSYVCYYCCVSVFVQWSSSTSPIFCFTKKNHFAIWQYIWQMSLNAFIFRI